MTALRSPQRREVFINLIVTAGGFIFYNTSVLNAYRTAADRMEQRAEYERWYGQYEGVSQPGLTGINLHVEIYPERREVEIRGTYRLVNSSPVAIDSIHLAPAPEVATGEATFDRHVARAAVDDARRTRSAPCCTISSRPTRIGSSRRSKPWRSKPRTARGRSRST